MLRKTILIAAAFVLLCSSSAFSHNIKLSPVVPQDKSQQKAELVSEKFPKDAIVFEKTKKPATNKIYITTDKDRYITNDTYIKIEDIPLHTKYFCNATQINSHQILIETDMANGELLLQITDSSGKLVFNSMIGVCKHQYFDLDFLESGEYIGTLSGVGILKRFDITI